MFASLHGYGHDIIIDTEVCRYLPRRKHMSLSATTSWREIGEVNRMVGKKKASKKPIEQYDHKGKSGSIIRRLGWWPLIRIKRPAKRFMLMTRISTRASNGQASRKDIDNLLVDKLPYVLSDKQKFNKINRLLFSIMAKKLKFIKNIGSRRFPVWVLTAEYRDDRTGLEEN